MEAGECSWVVIGLRSRRFESQICRFGLGWGLSERALKGASSLRGGFKWGQDSRLVCGGRMKTQARAGRQGSQGYSQQDLRDRRWWARSRGKPEMLVSDGPVARSIVREKAHSVWNTGGISQAYETRNPSGSLSNTMGVRKWDGGQIITAPREFLSSASSDVARRNYPVNVAKRPPRFHFSHLGSSSIRGW